jgi:hypothetical protein
MVTVHKQSYGFSCGPAALLTVMHDLDGRIPLDHDTEIDLWKDANLHESYATSAHGLANAALRRGFKAKVIADRPGIGFESKLKEHFPIIEDRILHSIYDHTVARAKELGLEEEFVRVDVELIEVLAASNMRPIVLISTDLMDEDVPIPHWIVILSVDRNEVLIANPETGATEVYPREKFGAYLGYDGYKAVLVIWR